MDEVKIIELKESIVGSNDENAERLRKELDKKGIFYINVMSGPGSGKTTLLCNLIGKLKDEFTVGVMEADIDGDVDTYRAIEAGAKAIQLHTGGMCHLDAGMSEEGLAELGNADMVFLENIGNLVCPAEFDTGAHIKLVLLSVTEGDDKPLKYSLMFGVADAVAVTKFDAKDYFDFDMENCRKNIAKVNGKAEVFTLSAKKDEGVNELAEWIKKEYREWKERL